MSTFQLPPGPPNGSRGLALFEAPKTSGSKPLHAALAESISHGAFADVKLCLFSRRLAAGRVGKPGAVYANSSVLKAASPYFRGLLAGGFAESDLSARESDVASNDGSSTDMYDYDSDSDLEDDDVDGGRHDQSRDAITTAEKGKGSSTPPPSASTLHSLIIPASDQVQSNNADQVGIRTIPIKDSALNTWQCLILYLYTGQIVFAPLKSQGLKYREEEREQYRLKFPHHPLPCSPKSMYRLADILGLDDLSVLAKRDIQDKLSQTNIYDELFSTFSSRYKDILDIQVKFFDDHCVKEASLPKLQQNLDALATGQSSHAVAAFLSLFRVWITNKDQYLATISRPPTPDIPFPRPSMW